MSENNTETTPNIKKQNQEQKKRPIRTMLQIASEFFGGMAEASADAFRGVCDKLDTPKTNTTLAADLLESLAEGNARFLEGVAKASRQVSQKVKDFKTTEDIDYQRLAQYVAEEMKKEKPPV